MKPVLTRLNLNSFISVSLHHTAFSRYWPLPKIISFSFTFYVKIENVSLHQLASRLFPAACFPANFHLWLESAWPQPYLHLQTSFLSLQILNLQVRSLSRWQLKNIKKFKKWTVFIILIRRSLEIVSTQEINYILYIALASSLGERKPWER